VNPLANPLAHPQDRRNGDSLSSSSSGAPRRLHSTRPPPLDLQSHHSSRPLPGAYQGNIPVSAGSERSITPRQIPAPLLPSRDLMPSRPGILPHAEASSSTTVVPTTSSVPAPAPSRPAKLTLRAPPPRDTGKRSPSPSNSEATSFVDRPLPPAPGSQSSAAEYASSITQQRQRSNDGQSTPTLLQTENHAAPLKGPAPSSLAERRDVPQVAAIRGDTSHRKQTSIGSSPNKQNSPIKSKFNAMIGPRATAGQAPHPFAASRPLNDEGKVSTPSVPPSVASRKASPPEGSQSTSSKDTTSLRRNPNTGYVVGSGSMLSRSSSSAEGARRMGSQDGSFSSTSQTPLPLNDIRRQVFKFINHEDGTIRSVNVGNVSSGVEVLERVLKKFGKWNVGADMISETDSDEDGDRLEVDGWGLYSATDPGDDGETIYQWQ